MRTSDLVILAVKNVVSGRIKALLSIMSVCIGIASISLVSGIGWGVASQINDELSRINTNATVVQSLNDAFDDGDIGIIKNAAGIRGAMPFIFEFGTLFAKTKGSEALIVGIDGDFTDVFDIKTIYGLELGTDETEFSGQQVIVDETLAQSLYYRSNIVGKKLQLGYGQSVKEYEVVAVIESPKAGIETLIGQSLPAVVYIPYRTINESYGENKVSGVAVTCMKNEDYQNVTDSLVRKLSINDPNGKYQLDNISSYAGMVSKVTDIVAIMISCVAGISVIVGGIGMMSSMISNVESRKAEIGIYMALGISKKDILRMYMYESVMISACGGLLGIFLSVTAVYLIKRTGLINVNMDITAILICFVGALVCGILFGYIPAKKAAEMDPINAIRWE